MSHAEQVVYLNFQCSTTVGGMVLSYLTKQDHAGVRLFAEQSAVGNEGPVVVKATGACINFHNRPSHDHGHGHTQPSPEEHLKFNPKIQSYANMM
eukprot:gene10808-biopygen15745